MSGEPHLKVKSGYFATFTHFLMNIFSKSIALVAWQASQVHRVHWIEIFICLHEHSSKTGPRYHQKTKTKKESGPELGLHWHKDVLPIYKDLLYRHHQS